MTRPTRLWIGAALAVCVLVAPLRAQDLDGANPPPPPTATPKSPPKPDKAAARRFARQAFEALRGGDATSAARLFGDAADNLPDEPALRFDQGVAYERAGDLKEAIEAYGLSLTGADDEVERRALFNLGAIDLSRAWQAGQLLDLPPEELAALVRQQAVAAGNEAPPDEQLAQMVPAARKQAATQGLEAARGSIGRLRDLLRRAPSDADARHNLELAQRLRKRMAEELEQQRQQEQEQPDQDPQGGEQEDDQPPPEQDGEGENQEQPEQPDPGEGEAGDEPQDSQQEPSEGEGESEGEQGEDDQQQGQQQQDLSKEEAERLLQKLIEAAMQRAKDVRERKEARLRRTPVEKDW